MTLKVIQKNKPTLVIGLGGLGGKTVNVLKGKFEKENEKYENIYFRVLDTDTHEIDEIVKVKMDGMENPLKSANLVMDEVVVLYDYAISNLLRDGMIPIYIRNWINPKLINTHLDHSGAKQKRQIGRAMLCNSFIYNKVRTRLTEDIHSAVTRAKELNDGCIDVVIVAGISGGTGSGIIIDISYMIHHIFESIGFNSYQLTGYVYDPEVQFNVLGIAGNMAIIHNLKENANEALKDIEHYMAIEETGEYYSLQIEAEEIKSNKNVFSFYAVVSGDSENKAVNLLSDQFIGK